MKILEIIPSLANAGAERFVVDLSNDFAKNNEVIIISLRGKQKEFYLEKEVSPKIKIIFLNKKPGMDLSLLFKINRIIKQIKPDIVHTHNVSLEYTSLSFFFNRYRVKGFFHTVHNTAKKEVKYRVMMIYRWVLYFIKIVKPITISHDSYESFRNTYKKIKSFLIYNGTRTFTDNKSYMDLLQLITETQKKGYYVFVNIARITHQKNQILMAEALSKINKKDRSNHILIIIGNKWDNNLVKQIESLKDKNIFILGDNPNAVDFLFISDAFLLSSLWEGMPISLLEALSVGCIPVCTPAGGIRDTIIDGVNGFLSSGFSLEEYINTLNRFIKSENKEAIKKQGIKDFKDNYSIQSCSKKYLELFYK